MTLMNMNLMRPEILSNRRRDLRARQVKAFIEAWDKEWRVEMGVHNYVLLHKFKLAGEQLKLIVGWPGTWSNFQQVREFLEAHGA